MEKILADKLTELVEHSKQMLKYAEAGNWEKLTENENIRQQLIRAFYSASAKSNDAEAIATVTRELLQANDELTRLVSNSRDKVEKELAEIGKGKVAINAYAKHMR